METSNKIVPLSGQFENPKALLHRILEDQTITGFVIVTVSSASYKFAQINMTYEQMALAALHIQGAAMGIDMD